MEAVVITTVRRGPPRPERASRSPARRVSRVRALAVAGFLGTSMPACAGPSDAPDAEAVVGRDSAGVRIVENGSAVGWPDSGAPTVRIDLEIGTADGDGPDAFGNVVDLDVDDAGRIYVLDQQAGRVVVFDAEGRHLETLGGAGAGPGELSPSAAAVFVGPDGSVTVPDLGNVRVTRYAPGGSTGSWPLQLEGGVPVRWDRLEDGTHVAQLRAMTSGAAGAVTDPVIRYGSDGAVLDTLVSLPAGASVTVGDDGLPTISLFEPEPLWDVAEDGALAWAMNETYEIRRHAADGTLSAIVRRAGQRRAVSEADRLVLTELVRDMMVDQGVPPPAAQAMTERMRIADWFPVLAAIHVAPGGDVWVQQVRMPSGTEGDAPVDPMDLGAPDWDVFDPAGRWLGTVRLPDRFTMMALRNGALYGVVRDDLDVQRVVRVVTGLP